MMNVVTYATWNSADKSANVTLSNSGKTCVNVSNNGGGYVRSTTSRTSGKWYWECRVDYVYPATSRSSEFVGVANSTATLGSDTTNAATIGGTGGGGDPGWAVGNILGFALDIGGGTLDFYKNNSWQSTDSSLPSGALFAFAHVGNGGTAPQVGFTANFGATAQTYSPPAGYTAGFY